jgi:hypothetical protein
MSKYNIDVYCVAITTDMQNGKAFVLSTKPDKIELPLIEIDNKNVDNTYKVLVSSVQRYLMTHELELSPQIINLNSSNIAPRKKQTINVIAGFLVKENVKHFDSYWIEFNLTDPNPGQFNGAVLETIQRLQ